MALRKALKHMSQKFNGIFPEHLRELAKAVSQIKEQSIRILDNPSLRQEAQHVNQALYRLEKMVKNLDRESKIIREREDAHTCTPKLTKTMMGLVAALIGIEEYGKRC